MMKWPCDQLNLRHKHGMLFASWLDISAYQIFMENNRRNCSKEKGIRCTKEFCKQFWTKTPNSFKKGKADFQLIFNSIQFDSIYLYSMTLYLYSMRYQQGSLHNALLYFTFTPPLSPHKGRSALWGGKRGVNNMVILASSEALPHFSSWTTGHNCFLGH